MPACPDCGLDPATISPGDALVALRSFPRRFRAVAGPEPEDAGERPPEDLRRRWTAVMQETGAAAEAISALAGDLRRVLIENQPALATTRRTATDAGPGTQPPGGDPSTALERLTAAASSAAAIADHQPGDAWSRTGTRADGPVSAADLLREAVHAGVHHLRAAQAIE